MMAKAAKKEPAGLPGADANAHKKNLLIEALSYIGRFEDKIVVIKYGGAVMVREEVKRSFSQDVVLLRSLGMRPVIVHGGGPEVSKAMHEMGHEPRFVEGLRVTTAEGLRITEMVLSGTINKDITARLNTAGGSGVGLSGKDAGLIMARKMDSLNGVDLGFVGEITHINPSILNLLLENGYIPVISPLGMGEDGTTYNINADTAASRIAGALAAEKLIFMTDVEGVLRAGKLVSAMSVDEAGRLISEGVIDGGMIPKVEAILHGLAHGVASAAIICGNDHHAIIAELFTDKGIGTIFTA